jgi:hypothetical protein
MDRASPRHAYRLVLTALVLVALVVVVGTIAVIVTNLPPSDADLAATLAALPTLLPTQTSTPTPVPTLPSVSQDLLVCQREAGRAMNARHMVGATNISGDHLLSVSWISRDWPARNLDDALPGVIMVFDVALEVWERGCAVYDRIQIDVYDGPGDARVHRLTVRVPMDDLIKWRAGEFSDQQLIARLEVTQPGQ